MENKASKYIPGLGSEFKIAAEEINMEEVKKEIDSGSNDIDAYTKGEVDTKLSTKANSADVYTKTQTDSKLSTKANSSDVYKKTETYSKTEVDKLISDLRTELSGGGTA
ncbi:hypothetical protein [Bacillus phage SPO1L1]|nr:hypothetical protein [Bacillus phage SPO1L1]WIT26176.1 hypothetical protein [Bacillus phage SPO1L2]